MDYAEFYGGEDDHLDSAWEERYEFDDAAWDYSYADQHEDQYPRDIEDEGFYFPSFAEY